MDRIYITFWSHHAGWCFDQPGQVEGAPDGGREVWNGMIFIVPSKQKYSIMILGLEIINPGPWSPKWTAVAHGNWGWDLTTQKISLCCAFSSFLWHHFSQLQHVFPSVFFVLIIRPVKADLAVLNASIFLSQLLANEIFQLWKLIGSAKTCNYYFTLKKRFVPTNLILIFWLGHIKITG